MKTKTAPFDVAEHLRTPAEQAAYINAWLEEDPDDAAGIARALGDVARARGMSAVARQTGLSRESLYKALSGKGNPAFITVLAVVRALGLSVHIVTPANEDAGMKKVFRRLVSKTDPSRAAAKKVAGTRRATAARKPSAAATLRAAAPKRKREAVTRH